MFKFIKDLVAPKKCYSCNKEWHFLCPKCMSKIDIFDSICFFCKGKTDNFKIHNNCLKEVYYDKIIILSHYKNKFISKLIKDLKFYHKKDIAEDFWFYLSELFFENEIYKNTDNYIIIYPPMTLTKFLYRWYNHSYLLSNILSNYTYIKVWKNILYKSRNTRQQSKLSREKRIENLKDSFYISKNKIDKVENKNFIIVDDVVSTWSTINEISKVLKKSWAKKIIWLIVASD